MPVAGVDLEIGAAILHPFQVLRRLGPGIVVVLQQVPLAVLGNQQADASAGHEQRLLLLRQGVSVTDLLRPGFGGFRPGLDAPRHVVNLHGTQFQRTLHPAQIQAESIARQQAGKVDVQGVAISLCAKEERRGAGHRQPFAERLAVIGGDRHLQGVGEAARGAFATRVGQGEHPVGAPFDQVVEAEVVEFGEVAGTVDQPGAFIVDKDVEVVQSVFICLDHSAGMARFIEDIDSDHQRSGDLSFCGVDGVVAGRGGEERRQQGKGDKRAFHRRCFGRKTSGPNPPL